MQYLYLAQNFYLLSDLDLLLLHPTPFLFFLALPLHFPISPPEHLKEGQLVQLLGGGGGV